VKNNNNDVPVLFLIFNRPDLSEKIFGVIKKVQPAQLFIAADGPRKNVPHDYKLCKCVREFVLNNIDWPCDIRTLFREENLGCKIAVSSAITWFFDQVESGIILEDDTMPDISFFSFCRELLEKYKNHEHIYHISGNNFQFSKIGEGSYFLSKIPYIWGWASWRRAWKKYDVSISNFSERKKELYFNNEEIDLFWNKIFRMIKNNEIDTWDYQWTHALFCNDGYAIQPQTNLVTNIGFDTRSNRTSSPLDISANLKTYSIENIVHPPDLNYQLYADINFQKLFGWNIPLYENRMSGSMALKTLLARINNRFLR